STPLAKAKTVKKVRKVLVGKGDHYFTKASIAQFTIENHELNTGDKIMIVGPSTGEQELVLNKMFVNGKEGNTAVKGDRITFEVPFRIRLSDKLFKVTE